METEFAQYLNSGMSRPDFELLLQAKKKREEEELAKQEAIRQASYDQQLQGSPEIPSGLQTVLAAFGPRNAEAARTGRIIEPMNPSITAQRDAQTAKILQDMKYKEEEAQAKIDFMRQKMAEANQKSEALEQLQRNIAVGQTSSGTGGKSMIYNVPPEFQEKLGNYYLTNAILPTAQTPIVPKSYERGENITNASLTPESQVNWNRLLEGNFPKQYSTGEVKDTSTPEDKQDAEMRQMVASGLMAPKDYYNLKLEKERIDKDRKTGRDFQLVETTDGHVLVDKTTGDLKKIDVPSKFGIKQQQQQASDQSSFVALSDGLERMKYTAGQLLKENKGGVENISGKSQIMPIFGGLATFPGTAAADAKARIETLKAKVGFEVLQQMRNNSKTGGALGQVSDMENKLLQQAIDSLDTSQSDEQVLSAIKKVYDTADRIQQRYNEAYDRKWGWLNKEKGISDNKPSGTSDDDIINKYRKPQ